jgi:hypothetical protein
VQRHHGPDESGRQYIRVAAVRDPNGAYWSVHRRRWPFPDVFDVIDLAFFGWIGAVLALPFLVLWPFWLASKVLGARWAVIVEHGGTEATAGWCGAGTHPGCGSPSWPA